MHLAHCPKPVVQQGPSPTPHPTRSPSTQPTPGQEKEEAECKAGGQSLLPPPEHQRCPRPHPRPSEHDLIWNEVKISRQSLPGLGWAPHPVGSVFSREKKVGLISGSGRSPGGGNGTPRQCSWLENPMDRGAWRANVPGVTKSQTGEATKTSNKADTRRGRLGPPKAGRGGRDPPLEPPEGALSCPHLDVRPLSGEKKLGSVSA